MYFANADKVIGLSGELVCLCPYDNTSCPCVVIVGTLLVRNQISYLISLTFQKKKLHKKVSIIKKIVVVNISPGVLPVWPPL